MLEVVLDVGTGGEEVENGHANRNPGGDLIEDQRLGAVRQGVGNVESAQDGAGVHDVCARPGQFHVGRGEAEAFGIFAQVGEQARLLAFELEAQAHDGVHVAHGFLAVRVDRDGPVVHARGQEGARGAQADVHAELGEQQYVGAADAAVGAVTEDKQVFALEGVPVVSPDLTQGKGVEQGLGGMRVPAVPGVDHAAVQAFGKELGRAAAGMADDDDIGVHGLEGQGRILHAFAFLEAGTGFRQPEGVGGKALACHVKRGLGAGARFGEEEDDAFSLEDGDFLDWPGVDFVQVCGSIKQVSDARVGDTITLESDPADEMLPGYKKAQSMVYCGIYPAEGEKYENVKDALEKLQVNDAAFNFEPETSTALGFGFRCGFLGLLHMEIIVERLEREFDLSVITTSPSVIYRVVKTDGTVEMIQNPTNLPPQQEISYIEEPMVKADIMIPKEYVGSIMELCQDRRGKMLHMEYITENRVQLHYEMPLNEVIYDFFDALKSKTRGYGSLDYEFTRYERSNVVKMDILLNKELVDAFSMIVHESKAYARGRFVCEKLKEIIPMHQFEVPIQAAIGQKVIARETVKAYRKDVIAKCYGGDISRKKKLLEKQKEGKKRMRQFGTVEVPQEAFTAVLKYDENK